MCVCVSVSMCSSLTSCVLDVRCVYLVYRKEGCFTATALIFRFLQHVCRGTLCLCIIRTELTGCEDRLSARIRCSGAGCDKLADERRAYIHTWLNVIAQFSPSLLHHMQDSHVSCTTICVVHSGPKICLSQSVTVS